MKKSLVIVGMLLLILPVMAQAVDYPPTNVTINISSNQYVPVSYSYEPVSTNGNTIPTLFTGLPTGSTVSLLNNLSQGWVTFTKNRTGWVPSGSNILIRGYGAFVKSSTATSVVFSGSIPSNASTAVCKANGFSLLAYPYPADVAFTNTQIAKTAAIGDKVLFWTNNSWVAYSKLRTGWQSGTTNLTLKNCGAFAYFAYTNSVVYETRPY